MKIFKLVITLIILISFSLPAQAQQKSKQQQLDERVQKFLNDKRNTWQDLNVPYEDGKILHDLILQNKYTHALEIGTSTGHSTIWLAWALSKTGGKLITIEIDGHRQKQAILNVREAGLADYVDFRLADAHQLVKELSGPFDFIFMDADKDWYLQYFNDLDPKLSKGGSFTAHNVRNPYGGIREFLDYVKQLPGYTTTINNASRAGISISNKR